MNKKYIVYLHSCGLSQLELTEIFKSWEVDEKIFFESLSSKLLEKYVKNIQRRNKILENYKSFKIDYIDSVLEKLQVGIITIFDNNYPEMLKNIPHTPFILYVRGNIPKWEMFWVVWSRKISLYGEKIIKNLVPEISNVFPIVSGWAAGCDSLAHKVSLESGNKTIVVIGTGIDQTYPVSNEKLFENIVKNNGAIISIFRIWEPWNPYNFPVRNEIVVWLSRWVLVVEAKQKSWSLITAGLTLDLGKDLFSVPWDIFSSYHEWTNRLIKNGEAKCVTQIDDILEEYNIEVKKSIHKTKLLFSDDIEKAIYECISVTPQTADTLAVTLKVSPQDLLQKITILELKWVIKKDLLWKYQLI